MRACASIVKHLVWAEIGLLAGYSSGLPISRDGGKAGLLEASLEAMDHWCQPSRRRRPGGAAWTP
jgi:hypothetical protein